MLFCIVTLTAALLAQLYLPLPAALDTHLLLSVLTCCLLVCLAQLALELHLLMKGAQ